MMGGRKPRHAMLGALLALVATLMALGPMGPVLAAEEVHRVKRKGNDVVKDDEIDHDDETVVAPEKTKLEGGNIEIISKTFKPPTDKWLFKEFGSSGTHVDIETDPDALAPSRDRDKPRQIRISVADVPSFAIGFPLKAEGNLDPPKGDGQGQYPPHWSTKMPIMSFDLALYNGVNGPLVIEDDEEKIGAFTVTNVNDTDDDGVVDNSDTEVQDELDLFKLEIRKVQEGAMDGVLSLHFTNKEGTSVDGTKLKTWKDSTKAQGLDERRTFEINQTEWPVVMWVEGLEASTEVRDIIITIKHESKLAGR